MRASILTVLCLSSICSMAQFKPGYYFTKEGTRIEGLLKFRYQQGGLLTDKSDGDCTLAYQKKQGSKTVTLTANDICCFVIAKDSFAIMNDFSLHPLAKYPQDFARVLATGRINLYQYYSVVHPKGIVRTVTSLFIEKNGRVEKLSRHRFHQIMTADLEDFPSLLNQINSKSLRYKDAEKIVKAYNEHFAAVRK